ncbi:MAG: phosphatidylinositol N-acetylglucosaminyltransferase subunit gpi1 [Bathelium mastoideum]|nr:MAG: phosphatidylinositol N-acetylglucosaminyltransferase subunit gpi1 [Bathelium mastoideum]
MTTRNALMRIFWPSDAPKGDYPGVLVGWRNSELDILVVTILQHVELRKVVNALQVEALYRNPPHPLEHIFDRCGGSRLQVLGSVNSQSPPNSFDPQQIFVETRKNGRFPQVYCPADCEITLQIIPFDRPHPTRMQYMSLEPISLALGDKSENGIAGGATPIDKIDADERSERHRKKELVEKLKQHTVVKHPRTQKEIHLPRILNQINCSYEMAALLQKNVGLVGARPKRSLSVSERVVESAQNAYTYVLVLIWHILTVWVYPVALQLFILGLMALRICAELVLRVLEWRLTSDSPALKDTSATAQQVDIRLQQFCYWPIQYLTLLRRRADWESITTNHPEYIRFFNSLWLVANDVIIGIALGSYIIENANFVGSQVDTVLGTWSIEGLSRIITWLMDWPAGLKLNTELAAFLGDLFLWVIDYWGEEGWMSTLRPALPHIIRFLGFSSFAGATLPISLFSDLVSLLTLHIYCFYIASARIYHGQLTIIISLFHLFRGKKRNVLRNRIDSCDYDLDQLLLGTILFTLLFFLLPTVFVFYLTFASARMAIIMSKAILDTLLANLNHFPLFALMLRVKDSRRLPGGIHFELQDTPITQQKTTAPTSYILLKSIPLPLSSMFIEYSSLANRIRKHYISPGVFLCLISGRFVPPIHRKNLYSMQYSMLPARRVGITELWKQLTTRRIHRDRDKEKANMNGFSPHVGNGGWTTGRRRVGPRNGVL